MADIKNTNVSKAILISGILIAVAIVATSQLPTGFFKEATDPFSEAKKAVADTLIDPGSAEFRNLKLPSADNFSGKDSFCGELNDKDRTGAYVGFRHFAATKLKNSKWNIAIDNSKLFNSVDAMSKNYNKYIIKIITNTCR